MENEIIIIALACSFGLFMAWGVGANDVANAMGTSVGSKALTIKQVVIIAAIFEFAGAVLASGEVTDTLRGKIVNPLDYIQIPELLIAGMLAALLASGIWLFIASLKGWPVSTTHTIVGAIVGFGLVSLGPAHVRWEELTNIVLSWILTPVIAGVMAYILFLSVQKLIFRTRTPIENARRYVPAYIFLVALIISLVIMIKGLSQVGINLPLSASISIAILISIIAVLIGIFLLRRLDLNVTADKRFGFTNVEKIFAILMIFTACAMAFAHGSNDVANAIGPVAAIMQIVQGGGIITAKSPVPFWIYLLGGSGIVLGLAMYGHKVIATIGSNITELTPSRGFAATLATAGTVVFASVGGLPVSTTQTLVGAILGVGMARGIAAINLNVVRNILMSWVITLPAGAFLSIFFYFIFKYMLTSSV